MRKNATLSACGTYRYWLERSWADAGTGFANFIMLNPSTADAEKDDPTIRKCIGFAQRWGYDGMHVVNLFALRATNPDALYTHPDPVGPDNDLYIEAAVLSAETTIIAWGKHGKIRGRGEKVMRLLTGRTETLARNDDGSPRHPLYIPYTAERVPAGLAALAAARKATGGGEHNGDEQ